jgi:flagellar biosynthesis/type III secretory pathway protein FliH
MLRDTVKGWTRQWLEEGRQAGLLEGQQEGEARLLLRQVERKFGALGERNRERIRRADAEQLLEWGERLVTAGSLAEIFGE